jgi:hypothetical protein
MTSFLRGPFPGIIASEHMSPSFSINGVRQADGTTDAAAQDVRKMC